MVFLIEGLFLVLVGVGLGKICVIIYRIVYILNMGLVNLGNIFVIIFINKVVDEMKERIKRFVSI